MPEDGLRLYEAWLSCADSLGMKARERLMELYPDIAQLYQDFPAKVQEVAGLKAYRELAALREQGMDKLRLALDRSGIRLAVPGDGSFPQRLAAIQDAPPLLFYRGILAGDEKRAIAIVGSRRETRYGREQAFRFAYDLAQAGVTIVSGLARGIDTAAHLGALEAGGRTIAILGSGIKRVYPSENEALAERIVENGGAIISEFAPNAEPLAYRFPVRNRLVSGLSQGVLLVEAREKSGTLITVGHALLQGREVFAMPGPVDAPGSAVPHRLLREGANLATCAMDILEDLAWAGSFKQEEIPLPPPDLTNDQRRLYDSLSLEPMDFNELLAVMEVPAPQLNVLLTTLEMGGYIEALPGRVFKVISH